MAGRGVLVFFSRRDGAFFFNFSEAGRGGCFFPRRDGVAFFFFFDGTGRGGVFFFFRGPGRDGCFGRGQFFWRDGAKSLHRPAKGGLNRPASRPCKALKILPIVLVPRLKRNPFSSSAAAKKDVKTINEQKGLSLDLGAFSVQLTRLDSMEYLDLTTSKESRRT